jgi:hypothetical protein
MALFGNLYSGQAVSILFLRFYNISTMHIQNENYIPVHIGVYNVYSDNILLQSLISQKGL